ncbi:MAG: hypothetical protein LBM08_01525, partial [Dysgonamonadaceae bacterium]|nr:hypothetical protein [Dysgonamonadaceae bacterium]
MKLRGLTFTSARGSFCTLTSGLHLSFFVISRKYFCLLLIALSWGIHLQAQLPLKAKPLNVFVQPVLSEPYSIDVLSKSELGSCGVSNISIELFADPSRGTASVDPISKNILYKPNNDFSGQDSLKYKLTCGMENSVAVVLINIGNQPEVVIDDACAVIPAPMVWGIEEGVNLGIVHVYTPPLIGDLDGNKWPEVISSALNQNSSPIGHGGKRISIFKDGSADNRIDFTTVAPFQCFTPGVMAIAKVKVSE